MQSYDEWCSKYNYQLHIEDNYEKAKEFLKGSKLYGYYVDLDNPKEMIAALYVAYIFKEHMFNSALERTINGKT